MGYLLILVEFNVAIIVRSCNFWEKSAGVALIVGKVDGDTFFDA